MLQRLRAARENESGFTLIELLIVIVILGILAGIVVFAVGAFNDRGQAAACKADKKNVEVAVEAYRAKFNTYPAAGDYAELKDPGYANAATNVTGDGFLRDAPSTTNGYTITLGANGAVTSVGC